VNALQASAPPEGVLHAEAPEVANLADRVVRDTRNAEGITTPEGSPYSGSRHYSGSPYSGSRRQLHDMDVTIGGSAGGEAEQVDSSSGARASPWAVAGGEDAAAWPSTLLPPLPPLPQGHSRGGSWSSKGGAVRARGDGHRSEGYKSSEDEEGDGAAEGDDGESFSRGPTVPAEFWEAAEAVESSVTHEWRQKLMRMVVGNARAEEGVTERHTLEQQALTKQALERHAAADAREEER